MKILRSQSQFPETAGTLSRQTGGEIDPNVSLDEFTDTYLQVVSVSATPQEISNESSPSFLRRHATKLGIGVIAVSAGFSAAHIGETLDDIKQGAKWAVPAGVGTEALWNTGAAIMILSAGKKIGNPLKLKSHLKETASSLRDNKAFRVGSTVNLMGAVGTSAIIAGATFTELPTSLWPGSLTVATASLAPSLALWRQVNKTVSLNGAGK